MSKEKETEKTEKKTVEEKETEKTEKKTVEEKNISKAKLQEYCILRSKKDKRVELFAGFEFYMKNVIKQTKMTMEEFDKQFESYLNLPA